MSSTAKSDYNAVELAKSYEEKLQLILMLFLQLQVNDSNIKQILQQIHDIFTQIKSHSEALLFMDMQKFRRFLEIIYNYGLKNYDYIPDALKLLKLAQSMNNGARETHLQLKLPVQRLIAISRMTREFHHLLGKLLFTSDPVTTPPYYINFLTNLHNLLQCDKHHTEDTGAILHLFVTESLPANFKENLERGIHSTEKTLWNHIFHELLQYKLQPSRFKAIKKCSELLNKDEEMKIDTNQIGTKQKEIDNFRNVLEKYKETEQFVFVCDKSIREINMRKLVILLHEILQKAQQLQLQNEISTIINSLPALIEFAVKYQLFYLHYNEWTPIFEELKKITLKNPLLETIEIWRKRLAIRGKAFIESLSLSNATNTINTISNNQSPESKQTDTTNENSEISTADLKQIAIYHKIYAEYNQKPNLKLWNTDSDDLVTLQVSTLYHDNMLDNADFEKRGNLLKHLQWCVTQCNNNVKLELYGSTAIGLAVKHSDMDCCVIYNENNNTSNNSNTNNRSVNSFDKIKFLYSLRNRLQHSNRYRHIQLLAHARVPILKITEANTNLHCDIAINDWNSTKSKTELLTKYISLDNRVAPLIFAIKTWAKSRNINDASFGTLNSFGYVLMVIQFLQLRNPAILPVLPYINNNNRKTNNYNHHNNNNNNNSDSNIDHQFDSSNTESLGSLLLHFFKFYCFDCDFKQHSIDINSGHLLSNHSFTQHKNNIRILDPINPTDNVARAISASTSILIRSEMQRAIHLLLQKPDFQQICASK